MSSLQQNAQTLSIRGVDKYYPGKVHAVRDMSLELIPGEFMVFVGPSGCGKTTMLRMIAGLEQISGGEIWLGGEKINTMQPKDRDIAMVFQNYALYPTMKVYDNIAFPLKMRRVKKAEIKTRVEKIAEQMGLADLLERRPGALSGGQRQRVALGRAMIRNPKLFLMDEPLSNLDAKLRVKMRQEIVQLQQELGTTTVYVTHDQTEAMTMGSRIAVMKDGVLQQVDTPENIYRYPENLFVAQFIGSPPMNIWETHLRQVGDDWELSCGKQVLSVPCRCLPIAATPQIFGQALFAGVRPEAFIPVEESQPGISASVITTEHTGRECFCYLSVAGLSEPVIIALPEGKAFAPGQNIRLSIAPNRLHLFDPVTTLRLTHEDISREKAV